ncbi:CLIPC1 [Trypoxylus dichotomus]
MTTMKCVFILLGLIPICFGTTKIIGRRCYHWRKQTMGVCTLPMDCASAFEDFINRILPQKCGIHRHMQCCVEKAIGERSKEMCKKYEELGFMEERSPTLSIDDEVYKTSICPYEDTGDAIVYGGQEARLGEFPHMALIGYGKKDTKWKCGGSLISDKFVLSAGHCLSDKEL